MLLRSQYRPVSNAAARSMRALSSQAATPSSNSGEKDYAHERASYLSELSSLRKKWAEEHKVKLEQKASEQGLERRKIVLERAVKLREHRQQTAKNLESQRKVREENYRRYKENLARTHITWEEIDAKKKRQHVAALKDISAESSQWLTRENYKSLISPDLFERYPTTTGIVTPNSEFWRHEVFALSLKRLLSPEFIDTQLKTTKDEARRIQRGQARAAKRTMVENFLNTIIENPEDRAQYRSLVDRTTRQMDFAGSFDQLDASFEELGEDVVPYMPEKVSMPPAFTKDDLSKAVKETLAAQKLDLPTEEIERIIEDMVSSGYLADVNESLVEEFKASQDLTDRRYDASEFDEQKNV